jgi:hypothetical protein
MDRKRQLSLIDAADQGPVRWVSGGFITVGQVTQRNEAERLRKRSASQKTQAENAYTEEFIHSTR